MGRKYRSIPQPIYAERAKEADNAAKVASVKDAVDIGEIPESAFTSTTPFILMPTFVQGQYLNHAVVSLMPLINHLVSNLRETLKGGVLYKCVVNDPGDSSKISVISSTSYDYLSKKAEIFFTFPKDAIEYELTELTTMCLDLDIKFRFYLTAETTFEFEYISVGNHVDSSCMMFASVSSQD